MKNIVLNFIPFSLLFVTDSSTDLSIMTTPITSTKESDLLSTMASYNPHQRRQMRTNAGNYSSIKPTEFKRDNGVSFDHYGVDASLKVMHGGWLMYLQIWRNNSTRSSQIIVVACCLGNNLNTSWFKPMRAR